MSFQRLLLQSLLWRGLYFVTVLLVNLVLSRFLEASLYGVIFYLSTLFAFAVLVASISLEAGLGFYAANGKISWPKLTTIAISWNLLATAGFIVAAWLIFSNHSYPHLSSKQLVSYATCYVAGLMLCNFFTALFYARKNFILPNAILIVWNIVMILATFLFRERTTTNIQQILNIYFALLVVQGLSLTIAWVVYSNKFSLMLPTLNETGSLLKYSLMALAANVVFFLVYRIDYWFVNRSPVCTEADLGNYIQASKHGQMLLIIPQVLASAVFPQTAGGEAREQVNAAVMRIARLFTQLYIVLAMITAFAGQDIFTWLFGATYNMMHVPFLLLLPGILALSILALLSSYFAGKGKVMVNVKGAALALVFVAITDGIFIPRYGIVAAAIISSIGYGINLWYSLWNFYKDYNISFIDFFRWRKSDYQWLKGFIK